MQQKTKFIIFIGLICFVSLLFLPGKVWGVINNNSGGGGGDECCLEYDYVPYGCYLGVDNDINSPTYGQNFYWDINHNKIDSCTWGCVEWDTVSPECVDSDTTSTTQKPKDKWCCTCDGVMEECYECSKTGAASTKEKCEECCPCGTRLECRHPLTTFFGADADAYYCKSDKWCEIDLGDECSNGDAKCIACNKTTWQCYDSPNTQEYTSFPTCESNCVKPTTDTTDFDFEISNDGDITLTRPTSGTVSGSNKIWIKRTSGDWESLTFSRYNLPSNVSGVSASGLGGTSTGNPSASAFSRTNTYTIDSSATIGKFYTGVTATAVDGSPSHDTTYYLIIKEPSITKYSCDTSTWTCSEDSDGVYATLPICELNCIIPSATHYSCNEITWQCYQDLIGKYSSLKMCESNCNAPPPPPPPPPTSPPPTSPPPAPKCDIIEFSINGKTNDYRDPLLVWVNASLRGRISTDTDCIKCTVESTDTWGNDPNPVEYAMTLANNYNAYEIFEIPETGTYSFTVTCQGSDPDDIVVDNFSLETVEAINLPWWREIIPVLPGFLRGIWE